MKLARLHAAGQLRPVVVPTPELEALRDLVRAREDLRGDLMSARHRISKLLLRRGLIYPGPGSPWESRNRARWLRSIRLDDALAHVVLGEYLAYPAVAAVSKRRGSFVITPSTPSDSRRRMPGSSSTVHT